MEGRPEGVSWFGVGVVSRLRASGACPVAAPPRPTLDQYRTNFSVICHRLCLPGSSVRSLSGQDTRGISLQGSINTTNVPADTNVTIFLEKTSVLQIGVGKAFDVVA